jgi:PAS domain S-box-containing protein
VAPSSVNSEFAASSGDVALPAASGLAGDPAGWPKRQQALVAMGRRAAGSPERSVLMQDAAALLAEVFDASYSAVGELSPDGDWLDLRLSSLDDTLSTSQPSTCRVAAAGTESLAGYVLQVAHPIAVTDLRQESRFRDPFLRKHGIRSAAAAPLKLHDRSFGALAVCSPVVRLATDSDLLFIETISHLVATTIGREQAEQSLADQQGLTAGVLQTVDALVLVLDAQGRIVHTNAACERITGFTLAEVENQLLWSVLAVAEEMQILSRVFEQLHAGATEVKCETDVLGKHAQRRRIAWTWSALARKDAAPQTIIATGIDVTQQREAEQTARRAEQAADDLRRAAHARSSTGGESTRTAALPGSEAGKTTPFGPMPVPAQGERRRRPRRSYPYAQLVGPVIDGKLPDPAAFREVRCNDIAAGGFSFFSTSPPTFDLLVVALGIAPRVSYLMAQVAHITRVEEDGQRHYLVGCTYVGRAVY